MSNSRAIASITATLSSILTAVASAAWPGSTVHVGRPDQRRDPEHDAPGINLFLFRMLVDSSLRNADLPSRNGEGRLLQRPAIGLELNYLMTFYGPGVVPDLLIGRTMSTLHAQPLLSKGLIASAVAQAGALPGESSLRPLDVDPAQAVHVNPMNLSLEELARLWSAFFQTPYAPSVAYQVSPLVLEAEGGPPTSALPVREGGVHVLTALAPAPRIERITPQHVEAAPGAQVTVYGTNLQSDTLRVRFGDLEPPVTPLVTAVDELQVELPPNVAAGITPVTVIDQRTGLRSNTVALVVQPSVVAASIVGQSLQIRLASPLQPVQRAVLLLNGLAGPDPAAYAVELPAITGPTSEVSVPLQAMQPGAYLVRVRIDGVDSVVHRTSSDGPYAIPSVTLG